MQGTPTWVVAVLALSISLNFGLGAGIFAGCAGNEKPYDAALLGAGASGACLTLILAFWGVTAAIAAITSRRR